MGKLVDSDLYHVAIVRSQLTRNITVLFDAIKEEIALGFEESIGANGLGIFHFRTEIQSSRSVLIAIAIMLEWVSQPALPTIMQVVSRASNRVFVGLPLCEHLLNQKCKYQTR